MSAPKSASAEFILQASRVMKTLGHPTRLEIGKYLRKGERSVAEIQNYLGLIQPLTSQHLRLMHRRGIVKFRREGTTLYYSIADGFIHKVLACVAECERAGIPERDASQSSNGARRRQRSGALERLRIRSSAKRIPHAMGR
jgi:DNA-binding transcriptional ArsR family regulator